MASHADEVSDRRPLLQDAIGSSGRGSYGSVNSTSSHNAAVRQRASLADDTIVAEESGRSDEEGSDEQGSVRSSSGKTAGNGLWAAIQGRDSYHRKLLIFDLLVMVLGIATAGILFSELRSAYGQCIIGMPLYPGGLLTRGVKRFWCRCPLYTIMLTSTIPWTAIMVNWVSDLFSKKCAFGKWLKWQAILTCGGGFGALCAGVTSVWGFGSWCNQVINFFSSDDGTTVAPGSNRQCYSAALKFDSEHKEEFVKLAHTFWFTLCVMILQLVLILCWAGACYYSVRIWAGLPKDSFFTHMLLPHGLNPRDRGHHDSTTEHRSRPHESVASASEVVPQQHIIITGEQPRVTDATNDASGGETHQKMG